MISIFTFNVQPGLNGAPGATHRDRARVFEDRLQWDVPVVDGELEADQLDTADAPCLLAMEQTGSHLRSIRPLPTTPPQLLDTSFARARGVDDRLTGPTTWKASPICASPDIDKGLAELVRCELGMLAASWTMCPLSPPTMHAGRSLKATAMVVDSDIAPIPRSSFGIDYLVLDEPTWPVRRAA